MAAVRKQSLPFDGSTCNERDGSPENRATQTREMKNRIEPEKLDFCDKRKRPSVSLRSDRPFFFVLCSQGCGQHGVIPVPPPVNHSEHGTEQPNPVVALSNPAC